MWRKHHNPLFTTAGVVLIIMGALILFARVLPSGLWWFCVGVGLVAGGVALLRR